MPCPPQLLHAIRDPGRKPVGCAVSSIVSGLAAGGVRRCWCVVAQQARQEPDQLVAFGAGSTAPAGRPGWWHELVELSQVAAAARGDGDDVAAAVGGIGAGQHAGDTTTRESAHRRAAPNHRLGHHSLTLSYDYPRCRRALRRRGITPRIARRGIESSQRLGRHRYVVERSLAWLVGYRRLQVRYERRADNLLGFVHLAGALICLKSLDGSKAAPSAASPDRPAGYAGPSSRLPGRARASRRGGPHRRRGRRYFGNPTLKTLASPNPDRRSRSTCAFACCTVGN